MLQLLKIVFFQPIYDEIEELSFAKKYQNVFDQDISDFAASEFLEKQLEEEYLNKFAKLDPHDEYFDAKNNPLEIQKRKYFDAIFSMKKSRQKKHKRNSIKDIEQKARDEENNAKTKSLIEFNASLSCSVKCLAIKKNETIKPTTRFFNGKMLMYAKLSLKSFVYEFTKTFFFQSKKHERFIRNT